MKKTLLCTTIAFACSAAYADVFELGQIDVVAEGGADVGTASIEQTQLQQNQITNAAQAAKMTSGVSFQRGGGRAEQNILVRGFDSRRVPVFIDGIPVYVPYDGNMDLGRFTTFDLAQINISKGSSSVLYGPNTLGGAINLVTQKPGKDFEGNIGYGIQSGRSGDTLGNHTYFNLGSKQQFFYAQLNGSFLEKQGTQLSRDYQASADNRDEDGGRAENSAYRDKKLGLKLAFTPNQKDEYALSYSAQRAVKGQPFYAGQSTYAAQKYWYWPSWNKDSVYFLSHTEFAGGRFYLNSKAFYDTFKNDLSAYDDDRLFSQKANSSFNSHYRDYSYGGGFEFGSHFAEKNTLKVTALYKLDLHKEHNDGEPIARSKDRTYSFGLEDSHKFGKRTKLTAGISFDRREAIKSQNYQSDIKGLYEYEVADKNALNYQIKLNHSFSENDELSIGYARKTRFATMKDRYSRSINRYRTPNPFLKPEQANHYEIGYFRTFAERLRLEGGLFHSQVKDAIEEIQTGNSKTTTNRRTGKKQTVYETMNQNVGKTVYKGAELGVTAFISDKLTFGANYTYIRAKNSNSALLITDVPRHKAFAYMDWNLVGGLSLYLAQSAETGRYGYDGKNYVKLAGFGSTDVKISYVFNQHLNLDAGISNIFDNNYYYTEGYPEEGRVFFANIKYRF